MVECSTLDPGVAGSVLTGGTMFCYHHSIVRSSVTERLLTGT